MENKRTLVFQNGEGVIAYVIMDEIMLGYVTYVIELENWHIIVVLFKGINSFLLYTYISPSLLDFCNTWI